MEIVTRSQKARGSGKFRGPNMYLAVVSTPIGGEPVGRHALSSANRVRYGWEVFEIGEYYSRSTGPKSTYARLLKRAEETITALLEVVCRCCGRVVLNTDNHPIHTTCVSRHWGRHYKGVNASRCKEFGGK